MNSQKKKRQTKSEHVLVRMEPQLKEKLIEEARCRALDPSSLARMFIADGLDHEWHYREMRKHRIAKLRKGIEAAERISRGSQTQPHGKRKAKKKGGQK